MRGMVAAAMWLGFVPIAAMLVLVPCMQPERAHVIYLSTFTPMPQPTHSAVCPWTTDHAWMTHQAEGTGGPDAELEHLSRCWEPT